MYYKDSNTMQIYNNEIKDGLADKINCNSIAFTCLAETITKPSQAEEIKAFAAIGEGRNFDLYYIQSILASVGINLNDDVFLPEEIWAARNTPIHKQFNYMHNEKDIIGAITDSIVLDSQGNVVSSVDNISNIKDIATQAVIWTNWTDKTAEERLGKLIASIEAGELYVSMECLFNKFDYLIEKSVGLTLIPRNEQSSFLTKHLRTFGGDGQFDGGKIYRVLRDFTFSGKGLVNKPANPRSIISDSLFGGKAIAEVDINKLLSSKSEYIMTEEVLKKEIAELKEALAKANEAIAVFKDVEAKQVTAEVNGLKAQIDALKTLAADTKAAMEDMEKEDKKKMDEAKCEADKRFAETEAKLVEAQAKLAEAQVEKIVAERCSKLVAANVDEAKAKEVVKTFASLNDEQFTQIVALYENKAPEKTTASTSVDDAITQATAGTSNVNLNLNSDQTEDRITTLTKSLAVNLNLSKKKSKE